jgi:3-phenylpropionate/cinnamic acid dioxygenase small subunit
MLRRRMSAETDRNEIVAVLDRYAEALDGRRWELLREVFVADVRFDFGEWAATSLDHAVASIRGYLDGCGPTQHLLGNYRVRVDGDTAESRVYVRAFHLGVGGATGKSYEMGGEYQDVLRRTPAGWRIAQRRGVVFFEHGTRDVFTAR